MRWRGRRQSDNVEDRRGQSRRAGGGFQFPFPRGGRRGGGLPGGMRIPVGKGGISGVGLVIVVVLFLVMGGDLGSLLQQAPVSTSQQTPQSQQLPRSTSDELAKFTAVVLADTEDTWRAIFQSEFNQTYREPKLVLFSGFVRSACGAAQAATGPFYCPGDQKVYIDLGFFQELKTRFRAPGDFAQAYVIAHEIGHHVQTLMGISDAVRKEQARVSRTQANAIQVRMELQADCFAGIWANHTNKAKQILEDGDIEEALGAASAIGDDRIQKQTQGRVVPDAFTHGSSAQRMRWFRRGLDTGQIRRCDTFKASQL